MPCAENGYKVCSKCRERKPATSAHYAASKNNRDKLASHCRTCLNAHAAAWKKLYPRRFAAHKKRYRDAHVPGWPGLTNSRADAFRNEFRIAPEDYLARMEAQAHACAICSKPFLSLWGACVDHNHATGSVRGLLCRVCNAALGQFGDSPERLERAKTYLCKHSLLSV